MFPYDVKVYFNNHGGKIERTCKIIGVMGMHFFDDCICIYALNRFFRYNLSEVEKIETWVNEKDKSNTNEENEVYLHERIIL